MLCIGAVGVLDPRARMQRNWLTVAGGSYVRGSGGYRRTRRSPSGRSHRPERSIHVRAGSAAANPWPGPSVARWSSMRSRYRTPSLAWIRSLAPHAGSRSGIASLPPRCLATTTSACHQSSRDICCFVDHCSWASSPPESHGITQTSTSSGFARPSSSTARRWILPLRLRVDGPHQRALPRCFRFNERRSVRDSTTPLNDFRIRSRL